MGAYDTDGESSLTSPNHSDDGTFEKKCGICKKRFRSQSSWDRHGRKRNSGCKAHQTCFPYDQNLDHARDSLHSKCFIVGCESMYARGSWADSDIVDHVKEEHTDWGSSSSSEDDYSD